MKKVFLGIVGAAIIALAAINLNLALNSDSNVNLTLASVVSLAKEEWGGPGGKCAVCLQKIDECTCEGGITILCDQYCSFTAKCWWSITAFPNPLYPCYITGKPYDRCIGQCP